MSTCAITCFHYWGLIVLTAGPSNALIVSTSISGYERRYLIGLKGRADHHHHHNQASRVVQHMH